MNPRRVTPLWLLAVLLLAGALPFRASAAFVYETPGEFLTAADFNGDGIPDVLVLDKLTGNVRVGYADANGVLIWSSSLVTGVENVSGCAAGHLKLTTRDTLAVTSANLNRVQLYDLLNTNSASSLGTSTAMGLGPHSLASLAAPFGSPPPPFDTLLVASSLNDAPAERLDLITNFPIGFSSSAGQFPETGSFERANALPLTTNGPTLAVGLVRGTNDTLHLWQFTNAPAVVLALSNLPPGSDYVFGNFNGELLPRFIVYQPGGTNLAVYALTAVNTDFAFGPGTVVNLSEPVQQVFYLQMGSDGSALLRFGDGVQGLRLPGGVAVLSSKYSSGGGAAGNVFTGVAPLADGKFVLFDAPPGGVASAHEQVIQFDGANFTPKGAANLPALTSNTTRANAWLFQLEPFVNRDAGFIASVNASDWSDAISGLPGALNVVRETDAGTNSGLGSASASALGAPPIGTTNGLPNQYHAAISVFSYSPPRAAEPVNILIAPPPGTYGGPIQISLSWPGNGRQAFYRIGTSDPWHSYVGPFPLTNDATVEYYGSLLISPARSQVQFASYTVGNRVVIPPLPANPNPDNTNPPPVQPTNAIVLSQNGTLFYGRVSFADNYTIWAINLDGSGDTFVTTGARPRITRDGRHLAFLRGGNPLVTEGNVYVRDMLTGQETLLYANTNYTIGYDWDLSETNLVFDWNCWLWSSPIGGPSSVLPLPAPDCYDDAPVVNPVDGRLAFHNLGSPNLSGIYISSQGYTNKQKLNLGVTGASWPAWSPDGNWLAFVDGNNANSAFTGDGGKNLWVVRSDGTNLNQITGFSGGVNGFPHGAIWSPEGQALVGAATIFGTNGLWIIPLTPELDGCAGPPLLLPTSPGDRIDFAGSVVVAPPPPAVASQGPPLSVRETPDSVIVYWSTNTVGYTLESAAIPLAGAWTPIAGPYNVVNGVFEYSEARASLSTAKLFRLHLTGAIGQSRPQANSIDRESNPVSASRPTSPTLYHRNQLLRGE